MTKELASVILVFMLVVSATAIRVYAEDEPASKHPQEIIIVINGEAKTFEPVPQIINGYTMLPLRAICEALGMEVGYDSETKTATLKNDSTIIVHKIGEATLDVNGEKKEFETNSVIVNSYTLVPARMIAESIGADVGWDGATKTVTIITDAKLQADTEKPTITISQPDPASVDVGGTVQFTVDVTDNSELAILDLTSLVRLNGFTANIAVDKSNATSNNVTLTNIQGDSGAKTITIGGGAAVDSSNYHSEETNSPPFNLGGTETSDATAPTITISAPDKNMVSNDGTDTIMYTVSYDDNVKVSSIILTPGMIILNGFKAEVAVTGSDNTRTVTLSSIKAEGASGEKSITITGGTAMDSSGNLSEAATSQPFRIKP